MGEMRSQLITCSVVSIGDGWHYMVWCLTRDAHALQQLKEGRCTTQKFSSLPNSLPNIGG